MRRCRCRADTNSVVTGIWHSCLQLNLMQKSYMYCTFFQPMFRCISAHEESNWNNDFIRLIMWFTLDSFVAEKRRRMENVTILKMVLIRFIHRIGWEYCRAIRHIKNQFWMASAEIYLCISSVSAICTERAILLLMSKAMRFHLVYVIYYAPNSHYYASLLFSPPSNWFTFRFFNKKKTTIYHYLLFLQVNHRFIFILFFNQEAHSKRKIHGF